MQRKYFCTVLLVAISAMEAPTASAQTCVPPPGFVDTPHPEIAPVEELLSHTEEITIERPLAFLIELASKTPLAQAIDRSGGLPGVTGTHRLTEGKFGPGTRRLVCLTDGSTVSEQVLVMEENPNSTLYRYVVWNYTSPAFPPIDYAVGESVRTAVGDTRTHVRWTYSFQPNREKYPGSLGKSGDLKFREMFLEREFAQKMRNSLANGKKRAEELPPSVDPSKQPGEATTAGDARIQTTR
jgi:hypothetical protein